MVIPDNWIKSFNDPELEAIIDEALQNNLNLQAAASQVESAGGLVTQAGAQLLPVVAASGEAAQTGYEGLSSTSSSNVGLSASWELDIWGRVRAEKSAAEAGLDETIANFEFARLSLKGQTAKSWYTATETTQQLKFAAEVTELYKKTLDIVSTKHEFGDADMTDVHLARADLASAEERMRQLDGAHRAAIRSLELLLGRYPSAELEVSDEFVPVPPSVPAGLPSELLERRPDLIAAERRVAQAFNLTTAAKAARLPTLSLSVAGGASNSQLTSLLGAGDTFWNAGANFMGPIFTGGALAAQVDIRNAQQEGTLAQYGQQALVAFGEVETALTNETLLKERAAFLESVVENNQSAVTLAQDKYNAGAIELLNLLQIQARLINSKVAFISLQNSRLTERINLHLALGGDFSSAEPQP